MRDGRNIERILAAVDLGPDTERILAYALWLAQMAGTVPSEIQMLYVMDYALTPPAYMAPYIEKEKERDEAGMQRWAETLKGFGVKAKSAIAVGRLTETFSTAIRELNIDVMVLGHKSHLIRPSSSERLIKSLDVPMLVVRGQKSEKAVPGKVAVKRILCATDFSEPSKKAFGLALSLSERSAAELTVAHVVPGVQLEKDLQRLSGMSEADKDSYKYGLMKDAEMRMCAFLQSCGRVEHIVRLGVPCKMINDIAVEKDADLIIMGARGLSYIKGILLGSVSESIIKASPCPVLIVR